MLPQILTKIRDYMSANPVNITAGSDGRIDSAVNESVILEKIAKRFPGVKESPPRHWWDFAIEQDGIFYPVNIKLTEFGAADNLNCKLGIYYALTGQLPSFANEMRWDEFFCRLREDMRENKRDYYFMVFNKTDMSDVFVSGLKTINTLVPNGNNLPFQCQWHNNRTPVAREFNEASDFLLCTLARSVTLRSKIYASFREYFPDYLEKIGSERH